MVIRRVLIAAVFVAAAACSSNNSNPSPAPSSTTGTTTGSGTSTSTGTTTTVNIPVNAMVLTTTAFAPNPVTVKVGDSIMWVNTDSIAHTSTANNGTTWNSGTIAPGGSFKTTLTTAGTFAYHCAFHPGMVGTVTVQ